jgi:hypothetical protein
MAGHADALRPAIALEKFVVLHPRHVGQSLHDFVLLPEPQIIEKGG